MAKVIPIDDGSLPVAICPECQCAAWHIEVKSFRSDCDDITAFECCDCGFRIVMDESEEVTTFTMEE